jgi:cell division protein FtsB
MILRYLQWVLWAACLSLLYILVLGPHSLRYVYLHEQQVAQKTEELQQLQLHNQALLQDIAYIKQHPAAIEEQARYVFGLVKPGEVYYQLVEPVE